MNLFNSCPIRYPALQAALGVALAQARETAIDAYMGSITLTQPALPGNRQSIALCMRRFQASAAPAKRAILWRKAYERWSTWDFDRANFHSHLTWVSRSDIDYALVGFAVECMSEDDRENVGARVIAELNSIQDDWHVSTVDVVSEVHRILSRFQPYAHAVATLTSSQDWLTDATIYYPFVLHDCGYFVMKYRINPAG